MEFMGECMWTQRCELLLQILLSNQDQMQNKTSSVVQDKSEIAYSHKIHAESFSDLAS